MGTMVLYYNKMEAVNLLKHMHPKLIDAFGGEEKIKALPKFEIDNSKITMTECLDFIRYDEVSEPVMWGLDRFSRLFFVFKLQFTGDEGGVRKYAEIAFQRYTNETMWVSANTTGHNIMWKGNLDTLCENVRKLLGEGTMNGVYNYYMGENGNFVLG